MPTKREWRYPCPKCKARVGETCTYLTDAQRWTGYGRDAMQEVLHRQGDPCVRSHNERLTYRPRRIPVLVHGPSPAVRALWEYDRHEYQAMRSWLRANSALFQLDNTQHMR